MTRISSLIAAIADAALTVAIGLGLPLAITIASWLITGGFQTTEFEVPFTIAAAIWALGLGGGVGFSIGPETYPGLGIAEPFTFVVSVAPIAFTALIVWLGWRGGHRLSEEDAPWTGIAGSTAAFAVGSWLSLTFATADPMRVDVQGAVTVGTLTWFAALMVGSRFWEYLPWGNWVGDRLDDLAAIAARAVRIAAGLVVGIFALATALLLIALVTSMGRVIGLLELLQLDIASVIGIGLLQLAYLPTLIVWSAGWLLGPGIQLGSGSSATLGGTDAGPLPVVPLLGMLPENTSAYLWALLALPVVLAAVIALISRTRNAGIDNRLWWERLLPITFGAFIASVALAVLAQLSRGSLGPGRLTEFGPQPWWILLAAFGLFLCGGAIGAFLPLEPLNEAEMSAGSESSVDEPDPKTQAHLVPFHNLLGRVLGDRDHDEETAADQEPSGTAEPRSSSPYARPPKRTELRDAVQRPDEPDIYADIDLDDGRK